jgi:hypothetical protein
MSLLDLRLRRQADPQAELKKAAKDAQKEADRVRKEADEVER